MDLIVDLLDVLRVTDENMLVDELRSQLAALPRAAAALPRAHRQRTSVFLLDSTSSLWRAKISLHGIWTGSSTHKINFASFEPRSAYFVTNQTDRRGFAVGR